MKPTLRTIIESNGDSSSILEHENNNQEKEVFEIQFNFDFILSDSTKAIINWIKKNGKELRFDISLKISVSLV